MNTFKSSALAAIAVLGIIMVAVTVSGIPVRSAIAQGIGQASYGGVTFSYDRSLATNVHGQTVSSNVGQGGIFSEIRPEHISFSFDGYPSKGVWASQIRVIPLAAYKSAQAESGVSAELSGLERYLGGETSGPLPQLPAVNEVRIINENVAPVVGAGTSGVRFIASYAQGPVPVSADNITYMFIGLTTDHKYYVEGTFPVSLSAPLDPAPSPVTAENAQAYNQAVAERVRNTEASGFTPTLDTLDKMIMSIQVNAPAVPGMPTTGAGASEYEKVAFAVLALATILIAAGLAMFTRARVRS